MTICLMFIPKAVAKWIRPSISTPQGDLGDQRFESRTEVNVRQELCITLELPFYIFRNMYLYKRNLFKYIHTCIRVSKLYISLFLCMYKHPAAGLAEAFDSYNMLASEAMWVRGRAPISYFIHPSDRCLATANMW